MSENKQPDDYPSNDDLDEQQAKKLLDDVDGDEEEAMDTGDSRKETPLPVPPVANSAPPPPTTASSPFPAALCNQRRDTAGGRQPPSSRLYTVHG
jgi:hypothetical protein